MKIDVNGRDFEIYEKVSDRISYEQVAALAGKPGATHLTITYDGHDTIDGERYEKNGSLIPGESIKAVDGMQFCAVHTGNA